MATETFIISKLKFLSIKPLLDGLVFWHETETGFIEIKPATGKYLKYIKQLIS